MAERRFFNLEKKLLRSSNLRNEYIGFVSEYNDLGHMAKVSNDTGRRTSYHLSRHAVVKENSTMTKIRVVFDGSANRLVAFPSMMLNWSAQCARTFTPTTAPASSVHGTKCKK